MLTVALLIAAPFASPPASGADERDPLLGPALVVDGERVPDAALQRELIRGPGRAVLERAIDGWMVESELLQRAQARAPAAAGDAAFASALAQERAALEPSAAELAAARARAVAALAVDDPQEVEAALLWRYGGEDELAADVASELRFDATFLPPDPDDWPEVTLAAFQATPEGAHLLELARRGFAAAERAGRHGLEGGTTLSMQPSFRDVVRGSLRPWLALDTTCADPGIAATADLDGDGRADWAARCEALWPAARSHVTPQDLELAKRWLATERLVRARLAAEGAGAVEDLPAPDAPDGFSPEARARFRGLRAAFVELHGAAALADQALAARARRAAGTARVHAELMHFPTVDLARRAWPDGARARALERANEILARIRVLEEGWRQRVPYKGTPPNPGDLWREELAANGDLGAAEARGPRPLVPRMPRGVLGARTHAQLLESLGEDARWRFVRDDSLADRVFEIEPGAIGGPWDGRWGVALVRGTAFQEPRQPPHEALVREWILDRAFERYAREARAAARIEGLE